MFRLFFKVVKWGVKTLLFLAGLMICFICSVGFLALVYGQSVSKGQGQSIEDVAKLLYRDDLEQLRQTQGYHGYYKGYYGYDYTTECGDTLYSPLPGRGVVTYNGRDGTEWKNTMLRVEGDAGEVVLLHGNYSEVGIGDIVIGGKTVIGKNASIGNSTGCHSHVVWHPDETYNGPTLHRIETVQHTGKKGFYGSVLTDYNGVELAVSSYDPSEGGINCDGDCTTMASGDKVADWVLGQNGVYAAACPREWPFGTRFQIDEQVYECRDRGSWINCYVLGDHDPAYTSKYKWTIIAEKEYCWVDILGDPGYSYGEKTPQWSFVE